MRVLLVLGLIFTFSAQAESSPPDRYESFSRGFQQAKRVASLENQDNIPSRAYWLSSRLVKKMKSAELAEEKPKAKKRAANSKN